MSYGTPPPPPNQPYGSSPYGQQPQGPTGTNNKAIWALVLGILSILCCGIVAGIPALILGRSAKAEIDASGGAQTGRGLAQAGFILGIISIVWTIVAIILYATGVLEFQTSGSVS